MALIRLAQPADLPALPDIEAQAALRLRDEATGQTALHDLFSQHVMSLADFEAYQRSGHLWVAIEDQRPVGFIAVSIFDDYVHIDEVDVLPAYGRRGIGTALIEAACQWAAASGLTSVTLSTQRSIPWNQPYYEKLGFSVMPPDQWSPVHQEIREEEASLGFSMEDRVLMKKSLIEGAK